MERIQIVSLVLRHEGRYIVEQRELGRNMFGYPAATMHAWPSGHVEDDETHLAAIIREMDEELGIRLTEVAEVHAAPVNTDGAGLHITWFAGIAFEGVPTNNEGQELLWLKEEEVMRRMHHAGYDALLAARLVLPGH